MTVQDILRVTNNKVYVEDEARTFAVIGKFTDDESKIEYTYTREQVYNMKVKDIASSRDDCLVITVNTLEEEQG